MEIDFEHEELNPHFDEFGNWKCPRTEVAVRCKKCQAFARLWQLSPLDIKYIQCVGDIDYYDEWNKIEYINTVFYFHENKKVIIFWKGCYFTFPKVPDWYFSRLVFLSTILIGGIKGEIEDIYPDSFVTPKKIHKELNICLHARWFDCISNQRPHF